jgi:hypothetical protein
VACERHGCSPTEIEPVIRRRDCSLSGGFAEGVTCPCRPQRAARGSEAKFELLGYATWPRIALRQSVLRAQRCSEAIWRFAKVRRSDCRRMT